MATQIYVNLPVKDLDRSVRFVQRLGFTFDPPCTDPAAACMAVSDDIFVMLLTEAKFRTLTPNAPCDATRWTEALIALSVDGRARVDELVRGAVAAGGRTYGEPQDYGFMYQHSFQDPDGHTWSLLHIEPDKAGD